MPRRVRRVLPTPANGMYRVNGHPGSPVMTDAERYALITEYSNDLISLLDLQGRFVYASPSYQHTLGHDPQALIGTNAFDLVHPDDVGNKQTKWASIGTEQTISITFRHRHADGTWRWVEAQGSVVEYQGVCYVSGIARDISARVQTEAAQRFLVDVSNALTISLDYESTLAQVAQMAVPQLADWCAVDILVEDGTIAQLAVAHIEPAKVAWAQELRRHSPLDPNAPRGVPKVIRSGQPEFYPEITSDMLSAVDLSPEELAAIQIVGLISIIIVPLLARDRTLGTITFVTAESGRHYRPEDLVLAEELGRRAAIAVDNARLYRDAEAARVSAEQAYEAEQQARAEVQAALQMRDAFLSIASHELKTPLTTLLGNTQLLQRRAIREGMFSERDQRTMRVIAEQAMRLNRMIAALLDISRIEQGQLRIECVSVDLDQLVRQVVEEIQPALTHHSLVYTLHTPLLIDGDALRLEQVLHNLIQNAVKYSVTGGTVHVQVEHRDGRAYVSIRDSGIGIPADALPQLFQRFYRAANADAQHISGMGIGLYVVKEIVSLHGGTITVESAEGRGSTFTVALPLSKSAN